MLLVVAATQVLLVIVGLWVASDVYDWARWAGDQGRELPHPAYLATATGVRVLELLGAWTFVAMGVVVFAGATSKDGDAPPGIKERSP